MAHIGTFSTPEEAALQVARARAQALLNDDPLLCREEPEELTTGLSGTAVPFQQASVAARPAELTAESSGTASPVQQASELTAESSGTASSVQQATELTAESSGSTASSVQQATGANATPVPSLRDEALTSVRGEQAVERDVLYHTLTHTAHRSKVPDASVTLHQATRHTQ